MGRDGRAVFFLMSPFGGIVYYPADSWVSNMWQTEDDILLWRLQWSTLDACESRPVLSKSGQLAAVERFQRCERATSRIIECDRVFWWSLRIVSHSYGAEGLDGTNNVRGLVNTCGWERIKI